MLFSLSDAFFLSFENDCKLKLIEANLFSHSLLPSIAFPRNAEELAIECLEYDSHLKQAKSGIFECAIFIPITMPGVPNPSV
jgi:hypothetical protein